VKRVVIPVAVAATFLVAPVSSAHAANMPDGDVIRTWTRSAFDTGRAASASDANAARLYAMADAAMYDAVNGLADEPRGSAIVPPSEVKAGDPTVVAATAAHDVLVALYPGRQGSYDARLAGYLATARSPGQAKHGQEWGTKVAAAVVAIRADDGSAGTETQPAGSGAGHFRLPWDTHQRHLLPIVIADPRRYVDAGPPAMSSDASPLRSTM